MQFIFHCLDLNYNQHDDIGPMTTIIRREVAETALAPLLSLDPLIAKLYVARGLTTIDQADMSLSRLIPPTGLMDLDRAVSVIAEAIVNQHWITVAGDYDCDGATGTTVAVRGLRLLGAQNVLFKVPDRAKHGYGLTPGLVDDMDPRTQLIITVDSGTSSNQGVDHANAKGIRVVVTDHHLPGDVRPAAEAIVNPNQVGETHPTRTLAGVGVVYYVLNAVRSALRLSGYYQGPLPDLTQLLSVVAVGTVADLVPLDQNNRILVHHGLGLIRQGRCPIAITKIIEANNKDPATITATDIAFSVAPVLNAAGRIENMEIGVKALVDDDSSAVQYVVNQLMQINSTRKEMQAEMTAEAATILESIKTEVTNGVVVYSPTWHSGIVGLVASKLKESLHRPVFAFAPSEPGSSELRGSGRSIPGLHLRDVLADIHVQYPDLMPKFGGHAMAAGMSLDASNVDTFTQVFDAAVTKRVTPDMLDRTILSDGSIPPGQLTIQTAQMVQDAGPWGQLFPIPIWDDEFETLDYKVLKDVHLRLELRRTSDGAIVNGIFFFGYTGQEIPVHSHIAYEIGLNTFNGRTSLQLLIRHMEPTNDK